MPDTEQKTVIKLKDGDEPFLREPSASSEDLNPDEEGYNDVIKKLHLNETKLKYSLRRCVAMGLTLCAAIILGVFIWHLLMPACLRWLPPHEITSLKNLALTLFGALAMSIATLFYTKK